MLQDIRNNAQGTIAKIIVVLLVLGLSMFGVDAAISGFSGEPEVATVNGQDITEREFTRTVQLERQRRLSEMESPNPSMLDGDKLRQDVLQGMIQESVLFQDAAKQGLALSENDVSNLIRSMEQFQVDGTFSQEAFTSAIRNIGLGVAGFRKALREQVVTGQLRNGLLTSAIVDPRTAETVLKLQSQTRSFDTLTVNADAVSGDVSVTDDDIADYYDAHKSDFKFPESADVAYVTLSLDDLAKKVKVTDEELRNAYDARSDELGGQEQRRASHILIEESEDAEKKLAEIEEKLDNGADFAKLAKEYSADLASAREGGDLGYAGKGIYDSDFEDALFAMKKGEISDPVNTQFGYHIIKLTDVRKKERPSFDSVKSKLKKQLAKEKAGKRFSEVRTELADLAYSEPNLEVPADKLGLKIHKRKAITRDGGKTPFDHPGLVKQLYSDDVLNGDFNTEVIDINNTESIVARVINHNEAEQRSLDEVKDNIRQTLRGKRIQEALSKRGQELVKRLRSGDSQKELASDLKSDWESHKNLARRGADVDLDVLSAVFRMPRPENDGTTYSTVNGAQRVVLVALHSVTEGKAEGGKQQQQAIQQFLSQRQGQREYLAYRQYLMDHAEVDKP